MASSIAFLEKVPWWETWKLLFSNKKTCLPKEVMHLHNHEDQRLLKL
jgi:hypothetical protein